MIINETSERNDSNNWVKNKLLKDGFHIISFEGYTVKEGLTTALFDRRLFEDENIDNLNEEQIEDLIKSEEPHFDSKLSYAKRLNVNYYYVLYNYNPQRIILYRLGGNVFFSLTQS